MTLIEHLEQNGIDLKKQPKPGEYLALCPGCGKYKLAINADKKKWQCFRCATGGGVYALCKFLNIKPFEAETQDYRRLRQQFVEAPPQRTISFTNNGQLPKEFVKIGSKPDNFMEKKACFFLKERGVTDEQINRWGLGYCITGTYTGFLIIPVVDLDGNVRTWQGRRIWGVGEKSANPTNVDKIPFNLQYARGFPGIWVVEGPFDCLAIHQKLSLKNNISAIGLMGHTLSPLHARQIVLNLKPLIIYVALDPDIPQAECERLGAILVAEGAPDVRICQLSTDPDECSYEECLKLMNNAKRIIVRKINR